MTGADFVFEYEVPVRFRDIDAMGHAHHSLPLVYIEEARAAFWREVTGRCDLDSIDYVLKKISVEYHSRILFPGSVRVGLRVSHVGKTSFALAYELRNAGGEIVATAETVQVMFDYQAGQPKAVPEGIRERFGRM